MLPHELTCIKLFPHIARAACRDASRESSQIEYEPVRKPQAIEKKSKRSRRKKEEMWGHLVEKGQRTAGMIMILGSVFLFMSLYLQ